MTRIFKYELFDFGTRFREDWVEVQMPQGAKVLSVGMQGLKLCIWAIVDTDVPNEGRLFSVYGTGFKISPQNLQFVGTTFMGNYVWHLFEGKECN